MSSTQIGGLTTSQIGTVTTATLNKLSATQIGDLSATQVHALTAAELNGLSVSNFNALDVGNLTTSQLGGLTTAAANLSAGQINALTSGQISSLSAAGLNRLSATQIGALSATQLGGLTAAQIGAISTATLNKLSATQIGDFSATQVQALTVGQLNALSVTNLNALNVADLTTAQFNGLTSRTIGNLSASQLAALNASQANSLLTSQISSLSAAAIAGLSASQVAGLTTAQLGSLSASQTASLLANQADNLSIAQISTFSNSQLSTTTLVGAAGGLQFNLSWASSVGSAPTGYRNAVIAAAAGLSAIFSNNVVLNIQVGYGEVDGSAISADDAAESAGFYGSVNYSALRLGVAEQTLAIRPTRQPPTRVLSASNPTSGGTFAISSANAKALGLNGASSSLDGYVGASSAIAFEFNQTAATGKYDLIGALQHEFTEVMGRTGSVGHDIGSGIYTPLDLFRYTSTNNADPSNGTPERALTQQGSNTDYFSINSGVTNLGDYNASNGSEDYADWDSNMVNDPFGGASSGVTEPMSGNDAIEVAAIGWNMTAKGSALAQTAQTHADV